MTKLHSPHCHIIHRSGPWSWAPSIPRYHNASWTVNCGWPGVPLVSGGVGWESWKLPIIQYSNFRYPSISEDEVISWEMLSHITADLTRNLSILPLLLRVPTGWSWMKSRILGPFPYIYIGLRARFWLENGINQINRLLVFWRRNLQGHPWHELEQNVLLFGALIVLFLPFCLYLWL